MKSSGLIDIGYMDQLAAGDSFLHRMDPRAKLITTAVFILTVVSFDRYAISGLIPFFSFPILLIVLGDLPAGYIARKVLMISPVAIILGMPNPIIDRTIIFRMGAVDISGGWASFVSILMRYSLTVSSVLALVAVTGFNSVCYSLEKFRIPRPFITQLLFLYMYIFVLAEESERMLRAIDSRSFSGRAVHLKIFVQLAGNLLLRTLDRAERVYRAMSCRAFSGSVHIFGSMKTSYKDMVFVILWSGIFMLLRFWNLSGKLGELVFGVIP